MDPRMPGEFPPGKSQPPFGQSFGQASGPGPNPPGVGPGFGASPNAYATPNTGNQFGDPRFGDVPPQKSRWWLWLLLGGGGVLLLVCCGCAGIVYFSLGAAGTVIAEQLNADPVVTEHLGEVESASFNFTATAEEAEAGGEGRGAFDVKGTKASGIVVGRLVPGPGGSQQLEDGVLKMPSGEEYELSQ